jgi:lipopolysaccharide export system permease protein
LSEYGIEDEGMVLDRYLVKQFLPVFLVALLMFMLLLVLIDLFANLTRYLSYEVSLKNILLVGFYYLPKSLTYALPISLLFAAAYTLGDLYARNELAAVFSSGIPFWRFSLSLIIIGAAASVFAFFFEDRLVIPTFNRKTELGRELLHQQRQEANSDIVIKAKNGGLIYAVDYFDNYNITMNGVIIIEKDNSGAFLSLIRSSQAYWTGEYWSLSNPLIYEWEDGLLRSRPFEDAGLYREDPGTFKRNAVEVEALPAKEARLLAQDLRRAGLPVTETLVNYHHRFSFSAVSFVVMILSISMGGRFKKNILLMSLLTSLTAAVVFYITEMLTMMMARMGYIPPFAGTWFPVVMFICIGMGMLRKAKT